MFTRLSLNVGPKIAKVFTEVPYDLFCPKIHETVELRVCKYCNIYFPSQKRVKAHQKIHKMGGIVICRPKDILEEEDSNESEDESQPILDNPMPVITNILEFLQSPFDEELLIETEDI